MRSWDTRVEELHEVDSQMMVDDGGVGRWIDPRGIISDPRFRPRSIPFRRVAVGGGRGAPVTLADVPRQLLASFLEGVIISSWELVISSVVVSFYC